MDNVKAMEKGGVRLQSVLSDRRIVTELSSDFSLPDYQPEIKRLLRVRATVSPTDKYIGAGNAEFSGTVDYSILYSGNDGELYCSSQVAEYRFTSPLELPPDFEIGEGLICDVETVPESPVGRVTGPRKLCVKCRLRSRVRLLGTRLVGETVSGADAGGLERLVGSIECAESFVGVSEPMHLGDEVLTEESETLRVISAEGEAYVSEAIAGSGCVNCRGEVSLKLLCTRDGSEDVPFVQWRRIPFTGSVPTDGAEVNCSACAGGVCTDVAVTVEDGRILCEVTLRLEARAQRNVAKPYTKDVYSTAATGEYRTAHMSYQTALRCILGNFSLNTTLSMEEAGLHRGDTVVDLTVTPTVTGLENDNGRFVLHGSCRCHAVTLSEGEYSAHEFELPFRYLADGDATGLGDYSANVTPVSLRARVDGERLSVDTELAVNIVARGEECVDVLREASFEAGEEEESCAYTVCYPSDEDTLWSVAKRYRRPIAKILENNTLTDSSVADAADSLAGVKYLLV
ncbi:MAG: hypothetical protein E7643_07505 [Ruminococcaceae bacterium]|nr:hypothetical protein [Oscillospiraceae bacterium]